MNNYAYDTFRYIMRLKATAPSSTFYEQGMRENYLLEEPGEAYNKYRAGAEWVELQPDGINELPIGAMFIGVSLKDSMSRKYVVIAKDTDGNSVWFPLDTSSDQVVQISEFNMDEGRFVPAFRGELNSIEAKMKVHCEPGRFYLSTDINGFKLPFLTYTDEDDDDLKDDLSDEEQDILDRLREEMADMDSDEDDDDLDSDDDEKSEVAILADSIFMCVEVNGEKSFITVGQAMKLDDEIDTLTLHKDRAKKQALETLKHIDLELETHSTINKAFNSAFPAFMERSGFGLSDDTDDESSNVIDLKIPASSDEYDDELPIPDLAKYLPAQDDEDYISGNTPKHESQPSNDEMHDEDRVMKESVPAESEEGQADVNHTVETVEQTPSTLNNSVAIHFADTDGETKQPSDYGDANGPTEPFGADDSKWEGSAEYDDSESASDDSKPKPDFGDW